MDSECPHSAGRDITHGAEFEPSHFLGDNDPEFLAHVFDRFRKWDSTSTRSHRGLGLGLAIVSNLAELHGGRVHVASEGIGQGSDFTVYLPLSSQVTNLESDAVMDGMAGDVQLTAHLPQIILKDIRVLVVEDDPDAAEMLRFALLDASADARIAHSVADACAYLSEWVPILKLPCEISHTHISPQSEKRLHRGAFLIISNLLLLLCLTGGGDRNRTDE